MDKFELMQQLKKQRIVAVIRGDDERQVTSIVEAVYKGGIRFLEITFTVPHAEQIIQHISERYQNHDDMFIGAGTCLDVVAARMAIFAGAKFVVCPHVDQEILQLCNMYRIPCFPGAATVQDMIKALRYGADVIKLFPGDSFGPSAINTFHGPLPQAEFMPTGGINAENIKEWLQHGAIAVGTGGSLTKGAATGEFDAITTEARALCRKVEEYDNEANEAAHL